MKIPILAALTGAFVAISSPIQAGNYLSDGRGKLYLSNVKRNQSGLSFNLNREAEDTITSSDPDVIKIAISKCLLPEGMESLSSPPISGGALIGNIYEMGSDGQWNWKDTIGLHLEAFKDESKQIVFTYSAKNPQAAKTKIVFSGWIPLGDKISQPITAGTPVQAGILLMAGDTAANVLVKVRGTFSDKTLSGKAAILVRTYQDNNGQGGIEQEFLADIVSGKVASKSKPLSINCPAWTDSSVCYGTETGDSCILKVNGKSFNPEPFKSEMYESQVPENLNQDVRWTETD